MPMSIFAGANSILGKPERGLSLEGWWQAFSLATKQAGVELLQGQIKDVLLILGSRGCKGFLGACKAFSLLAWSIPIFDARVENLATYSAW